MSLARVHSIHYIVQTMAPTKNCWPNIIPGFKRCNMHPFVTSLLCPWILAMISVGILLLLLDGVGLVSRPNTTLVPAMFDVPSCVFNSSILSLTIWRSQAAVRRCPRRRLAGSGRGLLPTARAVTLVFET